MNQSISGITAIAFDFIGVVARTRMAFDGPHAQILVLDDEVGEAIARARAAGIKVALVSNNNRDDLLASELGSEVKSMFDVLVFASDVTNPKPHPDIFRRALSDLDVQPNNCAFIDDSVRNCEMAGLLGMPYHVADSTAGVVDYVRSLHP